jgi:hypothetical protein
MISPTEYARRYHRMKVHIDFAPQYSGTVNITKYQNGPREDCNAEMDALKTDLAKILKRKIDSTFYFPPGDVIPSAEPFFAKSIYRAYTGKGSPDEIKDVLRLACRTNRPKKTGCATLDAYAKKYIGLDCNGFVGNYHGLSPELHVTIWAYGWTGKADKIKELKAAERLSVEQYFPLKNRTDVKEVRNGDVLASLNSEGKIHHVALVDDVAPGEGNKIRWRVVEWGEKGEEPRHIKEVKDYELIKGTKRFGVEYGVHPKGGEFRYLLAGPGSPQSAGWGRCGHEEI